MPADILSPPAVRPSRRGRLESQAVSDYAQTLMDDLLSGRPDGALMEDAAAEFLRILEISDEGVRRDLIEDTRIESILMSVATKRAEEALARGDLNEEIAAAIEDEKAGDADARYDEMKDARAMGDRS